jgi:hypothetical protein
MENIRRRVRILETYAVVSLLIFGGSAVSVFTRATQSFDEISVGRLNVVEKNGQLRAVMANSDHMPDPIVGDLRLEAEKFDFFGKEVTLIFASWNQMREWLRRVEALRQAA